MSRKGIPAILIICWLSAFIPAGPGFCAGQSAEYLCELGISFYRLGQYEDALMELNKALMVDPGNQRARQYVADIFKQDFKQEIQKTEPQPRIPQKLAQKPAREEAINEALNSFGKKEEKRPALKIKGEHLVSLGVTADDVIWKQANADLNEKNYRILSNTAYDRRTNTYDTRIYDRFKVNLDTDNEEGLNFHGNITVDPWSFTGKSGKVTLTGAGGDPAEIELKYWSNTGYTVNETAFTLQNGDSFSLPEIKVKDGKISTPVRITSAFNNIYTLPQVEIDREFQPFRELWFDYKQDGAKIRFFPIAYQDQALTFDDPLRLSNNHIWWQQSPWLDKWQAGRVNSGTTPVDFTRGRFDDALSYFTRDSDGTRLTALRGLAFEFSPIDESVSLASTFASPKGLWQDYDSFDNVINATRFKCGLLDNLSLGSLFTYRLGLNENNRRDTVNYLWGVDLGYQPLEGVKLNLETAASRSQKDLTSSDYKSESRGNAYYLSLTGTFPRKDIMDLKYGYSEIKPEKSDTFFTRYRFYLARMEEGFTPALSNYRETRDDQFWSRHIHFRQPFKYYFAGMPESALSWDDIEPYRLGNGIDVGRDVLGLRVETSLIDERRLDNLFDLRNVHKTNGKFVENVARDEVTYKPTDKLTTKLLGIYQKLPKTRAGVDPFIFDTKTDIPLNNAAIEDGKEPALKTGSLGLEYALLERLSISGIWEHTNDYTLAYDNFPRGDLNSSSFTTFREYDRVFRRQDPFLYSQALFPLPPYPFYDIWKAGVRLQPRDDLEVYLDYTRNEFKSAGQIDENMNHIGLQLSYLPVKKLGFFFRYTYSRWNDVNRMLSGYDKIYLGHHNFFTEFRYLPSVDDAFILQYGESGISPVAITTFDPFGGSLATLDTRHIIRTYYRRKF